MPPTPSSSSQPARVTLTQALEERLALGHPWIYADALKTAGQRFSAGQIVDVVNYQGDFIGRGVIDPDSPIQVRLWTLLEDVMVDDALLASRIKQARRRRPWPDHMTTGFRLLHGEGDRVPGLVCDIYGAVAVLRPDGIAAERWLEPARETISRLLPQVKYWVIRRASIYTSQDEPVAQWWGEPHPDGDVVTFMEHGMVLTCDVIHGQKTGFFLDQRESRRKIGQLACGKRLLNLFGYTGGFSIAAAMAGASHTTTVDLAAPAIATARRHFELNELPIEGMHELVVSDVFKYLERFSPASAPFEIAVCDPPSFAHKRRDVPRATQSYIKLFSALLNVMPEQATVALASCSSHIGRDAFLKIVADSAREAKCSVVLTGVYGADVDHPVLPGFAEGDYLQLVTGTICRD